MPAYDDDQCVQCGAIRAAGSPLCVDCLVATVNSFAPAQDIADATIKELKGNVEALTIMVERLLDHISSEAVYVAELRMKLLKAKIKGNGSGKIE